MHIVLIPVADEKSAAIARTDAYFGMYGKDFNWVEAPGREPDHPDEHVRLIVTGLQKRLALRAVLVHIPPRMQEDGLTEITVKADNLLSEIYDALAEVVVEASVGNDVLQGRLDLYERSPTEFSRMRAWLTPVVNLA